MPFFFFLKASIPFYTLTSMRVPAFPYLHQHLLLTTYIFLNFSYPSGCERISPCVFNLQLFILFLATPQDLWDLSFQTRDGTQVPGSESADS